jgi:hypothetical protein
MTDCTSPPKRLYRAHINWDFRGATVFCTYAALSECGQWLEHGDTRWRLTPGWYETEAQARAGKAAEIAEMGAKLIKQAAQLIEAREEVAV